MRAVTLVQFNYTKPFFHLQLPPDIANPPDAWFSVRKLPKHWIHRAIPLAME